MEHIIESDRIYLRPWNENDAEALYALASDSEIGEAAGWPPHTSVEFSRYVIRNYFSAPNTYAVVMKETGELVGCCGIVPRDEHSDRITDPRDAEIGYWIGRHFWGQGLAGEAVQALMNGIDGVRQWWIAFYVENKKSRRVAEKCGFVYNHTAGEDDGKEHFFKYCVTDKV